MNFDELSYSEAPYIQHTLPGPLSKRILERQSQLEGRAVSYPKGNPIGIAEGKGATIKDMDGNIFIDFFGGAGVLALGHCNPYLQKAVEEAQKHITHTLDFPSQYRLNLVEKLQDILPGELRNNAKIVFGGPTGSDAVESAFKLSKIITKRIGIIGFEGGYHGMTAGALSINSGKFWKKNYLPLLPEVHFIPYAYTYRCAFGGISSEECASRAANYYEHVLEDPHSGIVTPAMTIVEPIQGEGGSIVPHPSFLKKLEEISRSYEVPIVFDEIQAGMGRTGKFFSAEHSSATPDIMTISKAIGGGYPLSAIAYHRDLDKWEKAAHIGTFRGNIVAMAAGAASIDFMKENHILAHVQSLGEHFLNRLKPLEQKSGIVGEVRGKGLMIGIEIVSNKEKKIPDTKKCTQIRNALFQKGVIIEIGGHYSNVLRFLPPLIISQKLADIGIDLVIETIESLDSE